MLEAITKKITDESDDSGYRFTFYCDICGSPWHSVTYRSGADREGRAYVAREWESEHLAAYERANHEAITHFNRCPVCRRVVCDKCFRILDVRDMCRECAGERKG